MKNNSLNHLGSEDGYEYVPVDDPSITFTTYDMGVATAFLCAGFSLITIDKQNSKKGLFVFEKADGIESVADDYFANRLEVKARSYFDHLKALKNMLHSK
ncbi:hypothetical protein H6776_02735 [Candidatus Nomurabacteria bacterium]|nr:hypothetical protein [Candidatus Nomurabacteria bacterium]